MRMSESSYLNMNNLATLCFDANAVIDNLAYSLDYHYYNKIGEMVHHNVAHVMPVWADLISDEMLLLGGKPFRGLIGEYKEDYVELEKVFVVLYELLMKLRSACVEMIESADLNDDDEVRIFGEDFLQNHISPFIKQTEEWLNAARSMDGWRFNDHIKDYTHFIQY